MIDALARCDQEINEIWARPAAFDSRAYLGAIGLIDWEFEKRMILKEDTTKWTRKLRQSTYPSPSNT